MKLVRLLTTVTLLIGSAQAASAQTADEIIEKHLAAMGGVWQALAYVGFFLNLLNLLPVLPLDGGRAMAVLGPKVWIAGILIAIAAAVIFLGPIMLVIIALLGGPELYHRWKNRHSEESRQFHKVPTNTKLAVGAIYLTLVALLIAGIAETYEPRTF